MELRRKLTLQFVFIVAGILLLAEAFIFINFKNHIEQQFYNGLRTKAMMTAEMVVKNARVGERISAPTTDGGHLPILPFKENVVIFDELDQPIYSFSPEPELAKTADLEGIRKMGECRVSIGEMPAMGVRYINRFEQRFVVMASAPFDDAELQRLSNILVLAFVVVLAFVALGGWFFAGQALAPVGKIINQADSILPTDLSRRLDPPRTKDELGRLVLTFNGMLDRIQHAFSMQRSFLSNVSHELKNPLTVMRSQLEVSLDRADRSPSEYRKTLTSVLEDVRDLGDVSEKLMQLARLHAEPSSILFEKIRLDEVIWQAKSALLKTHPSYVVQFEVKNLPADESKTYVLGNESLLRTAILNLLDNGCKFSPDHRATVRLHFEETENRWRAEIADNGKGIPETERDSVFQPFFRGKNGALAKGSGVGLSLVDSILKLHRVQLRLASTGGAGTVFTLDFPAA